MTKGSSQRVEADYDISIAEAWYKDRLPPIPA